MMSVNYLRISVTDRCNLRCLYCNPMGNCGFTDQQEILRFEEIHRIARLLAEYGISKVRLTGGEPLLRKNLAFLVEKLATTNGIEEVMLTTNGILLEQMADELKNAGLTRVNISLDSVESKLFGIGSESYVVGSHEFYLGYAMANNKLLCLDTGHFHPTEVISDKLSAILCFLDEILLHISRGVRWDSDHVVILSDELCAIAQELVRGDYLGRVHIGLDFFDASINRIAAWVIGTRCVLKTLLMALLEPTERLREMETEGDYTSRLAVLEELKTMPYGAVWDYYCEKSDAPAGGAWIKQVKDYEAKVLSKRT